VSTIDHSEHIEFMQAVMEEYRTEAWKRYEADNQFCWTCGLIGYRIITTIALTKMLARTDISDEDREYLAAQLAANSSAPIPTHSEPPKGPSQ
jgi:hypothetical protein